MVELAQKITRHEARCLRLRQPHAVALAGAARPLDAPAGPKWFCEAGSNVRACVEKGLSPRTSAALGSFVGPTLL